MNTTTTETAGHQVVSPILKLVGEEANLIPLSQAEIVAAQISQAVDSYKTKYPNKTEEEVGQFAVNLGNSIKASLERSDRISTTKEREVRRSVLDKAIQEHNIGFKTQRSFAPVLLEERLVAAAGTGDGYYAETIHSVFQNRPTNKGGTTFAYTLSTEKGHLFANIAVAVCRDDENFDSLQGKELAVERLLAGKILKVELTHSGLFTNKLSEQELAELAQSYCDTVLIK